MKDRAAGPAQSAIVLGEPVVPALLTPAIGPVLEAGDPLAAPPSERRTLVSLMGWSALSSLLSIAGRFAAGVVMARTLGPEGSGSLVYLLWIADFMMVVASVGVPFVATRFIAELWGQDRKPAAASISVWLYRRYLWMAAAGAAMAGGVAWQVSAAADPRFVSVCLAVHFFALALNTYYLAYLAGRQEFRLAARIALLSSVALVGGVSIGASVWGVGGALLGYLAGSLPGAVASCRCFRAAGRPEPIPAELRSRLYTYAFYTWLSAIVSAFAWSRTEVFFIERYSGDFWVAMFTIGLSLSTLAMQGPMLLTGALLPHFSQLAGAGRLDALRARYTSVIRVLALMLFPICLGLSSLLPVLLPWVYGNSFTAAVPSAMVLVAFSGLAFGTAGTAAVQGLERASFVAAVGALGAAASVVAGLVVIPVAGIWGAAWSRVIIQTAMTAAGAIYLARRHGFPFPTWDLSRMLAAAAVCAACSALIVTAWGSVASTVVAVPAAALVYLGMVRWLRVIRAADLLLLEELAARLPASLRPTVLAMCAHLTGSPSSLHSSASRAT